MKILLLLFILPIAMLVELLRVASGKPTMDEEWHDVYMDSNMNHGQGREEQ